MQVENLVDRCDVDGDRGLKLELVLTSRDRAGRRRVEAQRELEWNSFDAGDVRRGRLAGGRVDIAVERIIAALVFLTTMKELPATLILAPIGFKTLATGVWGAVSEAFFAQAAAPALLIVLVSSLPTAILIFKENKPRNE